MDYAEAVLVLEDKVDRACSEADRNGLTTADQVKELRRIAQQLEDSQ